jgi:hypothetical protein
MSALVAMLLSPYCLTCEGLSSAEMRRKREEQQWQPVIMQHCGPVDRHHTRDDSLLSTESLDFMSDQ